MTTKDVLIAEILELRPKADVKRLKEQSENALAFKEPLNKSHMLSKMLSPSIF